MIPRLPRPSRAEEMALFRHGVVAELLARELEPGELEKELKDKATKRYRPPGAPASRTFHWKTLQSWFYQARDGLAGLEPASRARGHALALDETQRELLLEMRREHLSAPVDLLLGEAVRNGALPAGLVSEATVRRLYRDRDLGRVAQNRSRRWSRRRWQASRPCALWHADVCHVWLRDPAGKPKKAYVHGILDDHSRYVLALEARDAEREVDLLSVLVGALMRFPAPEVFFVDNGSCYRGDTLRLALDRLGIRLVHAQPHDPESRGKIERFWRTLRVRCLDHLPPGATLHDVNAALLAFLDADYHRRPHAGLLGKKPSKVFQEGLGALPAPRTAADLARVLEVTVTCLVRGDCTLQIGGRVYEVGGRHLAGKRVSVALDPFTDKPLRASYGDAPVAIGPCDPIANGRRGRADVAEPATQPTVPFDPIAAMLEAARKEGRDE